MKKCIVLAAAAVVYAATLTGCSGSSGEAPKASEAPKAAEAAKPVEQPVNAPDRGLITQAMEGDKLTYLQLDVGQGKSFWYAAPQAAVNVGEVVAVKNPVLKTNYRSEELKRDFESIYFVSAVAPMMPPAAGGAAMQGGQNPHGQQAAPAAKVEVKKVAKASGGYTVGEIFTKKDQLAEKNVSLRATVVKFSGGIMGTNWLHLRDGTGAEGANDLTVTSANPAKVGDTVLVSGVLKKDVDIGSGYFFPVIIRDANVKVE